MDYIHYALNFLIVLFFYMVIMKIYMGIANYVGEQLGIGKFIIYLWGKIRKNNKFISGYFKQ